MQDTVALGIALHHAQLLKSTDCAQYLGAVVLLVPFWIQRAFAFRTLVLRAFEAPGVLVI
jgi:hypothetical protein